MIKILIVDDKSENLYLLNSMLDIKGFKTIPAKNGAEALGLMRSTIPDLIISDILMPVMDGFTLCRECKNDEILKNVPFFFYTATYTDSKDEEYALGLGADRFILKPQEPDVFLKIITDFLEEVKKQRIHPKEILHQPETIVLKEYNEVLIRKIEDKMLQSEKSEKELRRYSDELEKEITERKKNAHLFETLARVSPVGIFRTTPEGGTTYVNPKWSELSGLSPEEAYGTGWLKAVHPDDREKLSNTWSNNLKSKKESGAEYRFLKPDGSIVWVIGKAVPEIVENELTGYIGTITDITKRKRVEEALIDSEMKYRRLVTQSPDGIFVIDLSGKFLSVNRAICENLKYTEEELLALNIQDIVPEEYLSTHKERLGNILKGESTNTYAEYEIIGKDGINHFVEVLSVPYYEGKKIIGFQGIARETTERKRAEEEIRASEIRFRALFENAGEGILYLSSKAELIMLNESFARMHGYTIEELLKLNLQDLDVEDLSQVFPERIEQIINGENLSFEVKHYRKDGQIIDLDVSTCRAILKGESYIVAFHHDITERKRAEAELILAKDKAEESDRLKSAFLNNISHEVRTPMNAIVGFSDLISDPDLSPETRGEFIHSIVQASNQLLTIIIQIVNMATIETGQEKIYKKDLSLNLILEMLFQQFSSEANRKNISLKYHCSLQDKDDKIRTDETKLVQIISNLLSNALKFTKRGSVNFGYVLKEKYLEFYVRDTGIGIEQVMHEKIFERFRQVENTLTREYEGSGLGLSISKAYVELLGGRIWLNSGLGQGSEFFFTIPYNKVCINTLPEKEITGIFKAVHEKAKTLLVAEDENINFILLAHYLSDINIAVIHASNGSEAVEICKNNKQIDMVLMDLKMPVMDGFEATKIIKTLRPDLPIIAQTAYVHDVDRNRAFKCGCSDFISKPFRKEALINMIRKYIVEINT